MTAATTNDFSAAALCSARDIRSLLIRLGATDRFSVRRVDQRRIPRSQYPEIPVPVADDHCFELRMGLCSPNSRTACRALVHFVVGGDGDFRFVSDDLPITCWAHCPAECLQRMADV